MKTSTTAALASAVISFTSLAAPAAASAAQFTYVYTGNVTTVIQPYAPAVSTPVQVGDTFAFTFTFDTALDTDNHPSAATGSYAAVLAATVVFTRGPDEVFLWAPTILDDRRITILDDEPVATLGPVDGLTVSSHLWWIVDSSTRWYFIAALTLYSGDLSTFASPDLAVLGQDPPDLARFELRHQFYFSTAMVDGYGERYVDIGGEVTGSAVPVPEPASLLMLGAGLFWVARRARCTDVR